NDLQMALELDLVEAYQGVTREVRIPRRERCADCGGQGSKPGSRPQACRRCNGHGVVVQGQGFFRIQQTCGVCRGRGTVITDPCVRCHGAGAVQVEKALSVQVPPGVDEGMSIRLTGEGEAGDPGAPPGDLYCVIKVRQHPLFVRHNQELHCEVPITFSQAALGGPLEVPTLDGKYTTTQLPRGAQSGDEIHISG